MSSFDYNIRSGIVYTPKNATTQSIPNMEVLGAIVRWKTTLFQKYSRVATKKKNKSFEEKKIKEAIDIYYTTILILLFGSEKEQKYSNIVNSIKSKLEKNIGYTDY